jgi:D-glycero-alpha-D-manno-heptose-7-phosphate kinase
MRIRSRAPLRVSFGGGGTDVAPYCDERGGAVLSSTINRYAYATLMPGGASFEVTSLDYDATIIYGIEDPFVYDGTLDLAKGVIDYFRRDLKVTEGFKILLHNDAPPGSGLGSSSAITVALISAVAEHLRLPLDPYRIAELSYHIEREECKVVGGKQDQYAAAFGGFNFIEFTKGATLVNALRIPDETIFELEYRMCFAYVGGQRVYSNIVKKQQDNFRSQNVDAIEAMDNLKALAIEMKKALLLRKFDEFGELLHMGWENKKRMAEGISNPQIDQLYNAARASGAIGGKITGVGGGGFMFFICDPVRRHNVQQALREHGSQVVSFSFTQDGVRAWRLD